MIRSKTGRGALVGLMALCGLLATARAANVNWEDTWYPVNDGAQNKIFIRQGSKSNGKLVRQYANGYDHKVRFKSSLTYNDTAGGTHEPKPRVMSSETLNLEAGKISDESLNLEMQDEQLIGVSIQILP